jgi:hypothetical protein
MSWNPAPSLYSANWQGNPPVVTTKMLTSTSQVATTALLSTSAGLYNYTTTASNVLQGEINAIVGGGTTSLWANYGAIHDVDISGHNLSNADKIQSRFMSTMDLQVSSINGAEIQLTATTVTIQNIKMENGTVTSSNSSSSNTTLNRAVGAVNAVTSAVTEMNQAVGGFLSNNFGVLQQAYWGVATAGQVVDLANGTVQLATGIQAMVDSRQINSITGPQGPPGQTTAVYETFNHTTQFQFSTLATPVYTVYRTTDQINPNQTFGREIFISTIIPAGSKVVRSVSDPLNMPIASTQLLSTTNFIQSFGQWQAILGTDYNLVVPSTLTAGNISTFRISTGAALISSINGWSVSNPSFIGLSTYQISTGAAFISSINGQPASEFLNTNTFVGLSVGKISSATIAASTLYADKISTGLILGAGYLGGLTIGDFVTPYVQTQVANSIRESVPSGTYRVDSGDTTITANTIINIQATGALNLTGTPINFNGSLYPAINPDLTLTGLSTTRLQASNAFINNLTASTFFASTVYIQNIVDNYVSTTIGEFDIINTSTLIASQITTNTIQTNAITGLQKLFLADTVGNSYSQNFATKNLSSYVSSISLQQSGYFNFETNAVPSPPSGIVYINSIYGVWVYPSLGPNFGTTNSLQQVVYIQPGYAGTPSSGSVTFFAINSSGFNVNFFQQGDGLIAAAIPFIVQPGWYVTIAYTYTPGYYQNCTYTVTYVYQPIPGSATSTLTKSLVTLVTDTYETVLNTSNNYQNSGITTGTLGNLALNVSTITFGSNTSRNNVYPYQFTAAVQAPIFSTTALFVSSINGTVFSDILNNSIPYLSSFSISTGQAYTSSLQMMGGLIASTPLSLLSSGQYDFSKTIYLASTSFSTISSFQNNILSYSYSATIGDEVTFNIGAGYNLGANNVTQWASTCLQGNNTGNPMSIEIDNDPATGFTGTGTFDVQRIPVPGNTPYDIAVQYSLGGATIVDIGFSDYRLYRFTKSSTGVGGWTYVINAPSYTTSNNNTFQIYQNLTDVTIATTDNLNINAGSIKLNGALQLSNVNVTKAKIQSAVISSLTATNIQFQNLSSINHQTNNESVTNLYAAYINTSSININTQEITPMIFGNYSNNYNVTTYFTPPPNQIITSENDMTITSLNPSYTYTGGGTDTLTFDIGGKVWLNGSLQTATNWFYSLYRINNSVRVNISTLAGNSNNANFAANTNITNFIVKGGNTLGLYTSAAGFIGNIVGGNITLYWTSGNDFNTTSYVPWTGLTYISKQQITQTVSSVSFNTTAPYYISSQSLSINTNPSSNNAGVNFGGRTVEVFSQRVNGFITNAGAYGKGDAAATIVSPTGKTFPVSKYNCVVAQSGANVYGEAALALNEQVWQTYQDGGSNWAFHFYCTTATIPGAVPPNFYAIAGITMIPYDLGGFSGFQSPDHLGEGNGGPPIFQYIQLSTVFASTITTRAFENISLLAGNVSIPSYFSTGSITVLGTNNISVLGNVVAVGAETDVDIQANTNNVNIVAASTMSCLAANITMTALNPINVQPGISTSAIVSLSTINGSPLPWISTYNIPTTYYNALGSNGATPQLVGSSNSVSFPYPGDYIIRRKIIWTKKTGGASQNPHAALFLNTSATPAGISTGVAVATLPYTDNIGISTYATLQSVLTVTNPLTRNIYYYDQVADNYTASLVLGSPVIEYCPPPTFYVPSALSIVATGGTITTVSGRRFHTFTSNGSFDLSFTTGATIEIMIIGAGGGGGAQSGGGGGAGNMLVVQIALTATSYSVSIGPGGAGAIIGTSGASNGADTTFGTFMSAPGGGGGGTYSISDGVNGGCGGGGAEYTQLAAGLGTAGTVTSGTTISNLYNDGGAGYYSGSMGGAGGGGTSTAGGSQTGINSIGAPGGDGTSYYGTTYGGGGGGQGGGTYNPPYSDIGGTGGAGGGGDGATSTGNGVDGSGYGSGGGGGNTGGAGSSGICIVSYVYP